MRFAVVAFAALFSSSAFAQDAIPLLPDLNKTPGPANPALTQAVICRSDFSTKAFRKPSKSERKCVLSRYGKPSYAFTYDHLVPLELGGSDECANLWPQPRVEAKKKDELEDALHRQVCACNTMTLEAAQDAIRTNWLAAYAKYVTPKGAPFCAVNTAPGM